jgi:hypothetical protein
MMMERSRASELLASVLSQSAELLKTRKDIGTLRISVHEDSESTDVSLEMSPKAPAARFAQFLGGGPIGLPDLQTDDGTLANLLLAEARNPGQPSYDANDANLCFQTMKAVVSNRLQNPGRFNAPGATNVRDIVCAPGQFAGFSMSGGQVQIASPQQTRIDTILRNANIPGPTSTPWADFVQKALDVIAAPIQDRFSNVTSVDGVDVLPGTYGWRSAGSSDPGGTFVKLPNGVIGGIQFYTVTKDGLARAARRARNRKKVHASA